VRGELERIEIPGEHEARARALELARAAFAEREPAPARTSFVRPLLVAAALAALLAAAFSPPGRAVIDSVRKAIGVENAEVALFSLPAEGRLLVESDRGAWVVSDDGAKRLLGGYREASWSPFGRFVVAAGANEVAALEPEGDVRWKLARPEVRHPRWGGSRTDTRIAYLTRRELRVVGGDGKGDRMFEQEAADVAPAWKPGTFHALAYATKDGRVVVADTESARRLWSRPVGSVSRLEWSPDGDLLLVQGRRLLRVYDAGGRLRFDLLSVRRGAAPVTAAAFSPQGRSVAYVQATGGRSHLWMIPRLRPDAAAARELFSGTGRFTQAVWSPDGKWLLVPWNNADQWLFVRASGSRRVRAVANVTRQFESRTLPRISGWCCPG
jgi:dipeptidyl aminopeptidase/acylaminoacyl peptidase